MKIENTQQLADIVQSSGLRLFRDAWRQNMADESREVASVTGSHYFSKDTLRFFNAKVYEGYIVGNGLAYLFVESVLPPDNVRVYRASVYMPELIHYGYTGSSDGSYRKARKVYQRELMRKAKKAIGYTGVRGKVYDDGNIIEFRPYGLCRVMFISFDDTGV